MITNTPETIEQHKAKTARTVIKIRDELNKYLLENPDARSYGGAVVSNGAEEYLDGARIKLDIGSKKLVYVYVLPWSRGWSLFADYDPNAGVYSWRMVDSHFKHLSSPVYAPAGVTGAWHVPAPMVAASVAWILKALLKLRMARFKRQAKKHWYWPISAFTTTRRHALEAFKAEWDDALQGVDENDWGVGLTEAEADAQLEDNDRAAR